MNDLKLAIVIGGIIAHIVVTIGGICWFFQKVKKYIDKNSEKFHL